MVPESLHAVKRDLDWIGLDWEMDCSPGILVAWQSFKGVSPHVWEKCNLKDNCPESQSNDDVLCFRECLAAHHTLWVVGRVEVSQGVHGHLWKNGIEN